MNVTVSVPPKAVTSESRAAWLISAAALGSVAGLPWVFILQGPLLSVLFAALAAFRANQLWAQAKPRPFGWRLAAVALIGAIALGHPYSSTWPDRCFRLIIGIDEYPEFLYAWGTVVLTAIVCLALTELELRRRLRRLRALTSDQMERTGAIGSVWVGVAALAWSVVNETLWPNFPAMLLSLVNGERWSFPEDRFRNPCNPEVGWIGAALYALALLLLWRSQTRNSSNRLATRASLARSTRMQAIVLTALLLAQGARTLTLFRVELPMLEQNGGTVACGCHKWK